MTTAQLCICIAIVVYLAAMLAIGVWCAKKNNSVDDFYLGGRKLGPLVTAMSAEASDMSSWLLMGLPGVAYISGLAEASWTAIGLAIGTYINWLIVARRIRLYSNRLGAITVPQFFSKRWKDERNLLSAIAAVVIIVFFIPYLASGFSACGKLFASLFPLYVIFQIAQYLERWLILGITDGNWEMGGFDFFIPQWTLWYLVALMMFQLLLPLFETDSKKKQAGFLILSAALGMLVGFTPDTDNFMAMSRVFVFLPFYLWGYYERKNQILRHLDRRSWFPAARGIAAAAGIAPEESPGKILIHLHVFYDHLQWMQRQSYHCIDTAKAFELLWRQQVAG